MMSPTIGKISQALLKSQLEMGNATKGAKNPFFKSSYADLNAIREAVIPVLNANGITVLQPGYAGLEGRQFIRTMLLHESGEFLTSDTEVVAVKQDPQAYGSAISYARRYGLQAFVCIGAEDDDGERAMSRTPKTTGTTVTITGSGNNSLTKHVTPSDEAIAEQDIKNETKTAAPFKRTRPAGTNTPSKGNLF